STICGPIWSRRSTTQPSCTRRRQASTPTRRSPPSRDLLPRAAALPELPARLVPAAPQVRGVAGHDDEVAGAGGNLLVAARAGVALHRLEGVDQPDLDVYLGRRAHSTCTRMTAMATATST